MLKNNQTKIMKYFEDERYIEKQLYDAKVDEIDKLLSAYFNIKEKKE